MTAAQIRGSAPHSRAHRSWEKTHITQQARWLVRSFDRAVLHELASTRFVESEKESAHSLARAITCVTTNGEVAHIACHRHTMGSRGKRRRVSQPSQPAHSGGEHNPMGSKTSRPPIFGSTAAPAPSSGGASGAWRAGKKSVSLSAGKAQGHLGSNELPIASARDALVRHVRENATVVLVGDTGSGKTTQLPQ